MKILASVFCAALLCLSHCLNAQNILSYGKNNITKQEFLTAFSKNNIEQHPSEKSYRDYLELYIRFKLKVKAAYDLKMDTLANQKAELSEFRRQIEEGYLNDETSFKELVHEAFTRGQKDIHLAHIFISMDSAGTKNPFVNGAQDTTRAWKLAMNVYSQLEKGAEFSKLAAQYSSDNSARSNQGDIGYITVFTLPYPLENLAYTTPQGKFSKPLRSRAGYHIFKNLGERKAIGKIKTAQIVLAFPVDTSNNSKAATKQKADSIYNALMTGASFTQMADRFSNEINAQLTHGIVAEFGVGSFDSRFEEQIFALNKNGDITKPILTPVGYYIVKRLDKIPVNDNEQNDSLLAIVKQQVHNNSRMDVARRAMLQKIYQLTGFKKSTLPESALLAYTENVYNKKAANSPGISEKTVLFSFPRQQLYVGDFLKYLQAMKADQNSNTIRSMLSQYEDITTREYYRSHLEQYNPDFATQVKEFKEGNLLFEIMQHNVWDKASADSVGLLSFFQDNKKKYWWESSADAIIFSCSDSITAAGLKLKLEKNITAWKDLVLPYETKVQADSGRFELTQLPLNSQQVPATGKFTEPSKKPGDSNTSFLYLVRLYPEKQLRNFEDAKGFVLNDYQTFLEDKWISSLKIKYPVKINEAVVKSLAK